MSIPDWFSFLLWSTFAAAALSGMVLWFYSAPYGRHVRRGWGPTMRDRLAWLVMESPASVVFVLGFWIADRQDQPMAWMFLLMWLVHYVPRAFLDPLFARHSEKPFPVLIALLGFSYNVVNAGLNSHWLFALGPARGLDWIWDPRCLVGLIMFAGGAIGNRWSDTVLARLRANGSNDYQIPHGGLFKWVSCPNYLCEIIQWLGWALATWSLPGLSFALMTMANLVPRARSHHLWYRAHFKEYPAHRKALIPGIW